MAAGKEKPTATPYSPIIRAIAEAERRTTGEIRVHISRKRWDPDPLRRAQSLFDEFGMNATRERNAVLLYVNLRKHRFAVVGDEGIHQRVGQKYWEDLAQALHEDLHSTHFENALAIAVRTIGMTLARYFPAHPGSENPNELPDEVTED